MTQKELRLVVLLSASLKKSYAKKCEKIDTDISKQTRKLIRDFLKEAKNAG